MKHTRVLRHRECNCEAWPFCEHAPNAAPSNMGRYRVYVDGKLKKSSEQTRERAIRWIDNAQADWSRNIMPQVKPGEFDPNNGSEVTRVAETELLVTTTGSRKLRFVFIPY